jgi:hypothetical protein
LLDKRQTIEDAITALYDLLLGILSRVLEAVIHRVLQEESLLSSMENSLREAVMPFLRSCMLEFKTQLQAVFEFLTSYGVISAADYSFPTMVYVINSISKVKFNFFKCRPNDPKKDPSKQQLIAAMKSASKNNKSALAEYLQIASVKKPGKEEYTIIKRGVIVMFHYLKVKFAGLIEYQIGKLRQQL